MVQGQTSPGPRTRGQEPGTSKQGWGRHTHNGCTEGLEGMSPAGIEVGGVEPLKESHMVEALCLWGKWGRTVSSQPA